jgi:aspartokinase-like uncharacterized kinase
MPLDIVVKIGGSLSRGDGLESLCREIGRLGTMYSILAVPGGGEFADQVRRSYRQYNLGETAAHRMALLAMDQYGHLIHELIPGSSLETDADSACRAAQSGHAAVLLPSATLIRTDPLPHSWDVTSDTIAAWFAHESGCRRLVLLKDVDGLWISGADAGRPGAIIHTVAVDRLAGNQGGVDGYLARYLASTRLQVWIINGLKPERIAELLATGTTTGTRIVSGLW